MAVSSVAPRRPEALDEQRVVAQDARLKRLVSIQAFIVAGLAVFLVLMLPFAQPVYVYYAMTPDKKITRMVGLTMPNMTNHAVLDWAASSITEIMTMGFGDMDMKLPKERIRFTQHGWDAFKGAFDAMGIGKTFKQNQMVLTTVPSNTPVIAWQGVNADDIYEWHVQMPIIMAYANTKVVKQKAIVRLTIVRVPGEDSAGGIAIQSWDLSPT